MSPDLINACFELATGILLFLNSYKLIKDKVVKGVHLLPLMLITTWGFWNLYYYPHLDQWFSFWGGVVLVVANMLWFGLIVYYKLKGEYK